MRRWVAASGESTGGNGAVLASTANAYTLEPMATCGFGERQLRGCEARE